MGDSRSFLTAIARFVIAFDMVLLVSGAAVHAESAGRAPLPVAPAAASRRESGTTTHPTFEPAQATIVPFDSERWNLIDAEIVQHLGRDSLMGAALLNDTELENGVIEFDVAVSGARSYPGVVFRLQSETDYERIYVRPHRAGLYPDAIQYMPVINGSETWQLYNGEGYTAFTELPANEWIHVRLEVHGTQARVFLGDGPEPVLEIHDLKHGAGEGALGLVGPKDGSAHFSGFSYGVDDGLVFDDPPVAETPPGILTNWMVSVAIPAARVNRDAYPGLLRYPRRGLGICGPRAERPGKRLPAAGKERTGARPGAGSYHRSIRRAPGG